MNHSHRRYYFIQRSQNNKTKINIRNLVSKVLLLLGTSILLWVAYPLAKFEIIESRKFKPNRFLLPLGDVQINAQANIPQNNEIDYTQAGNWFPKSQLNNNESPVTHYNLSIPKLNIKNASVKLTGEDLSKSLIHYGGTTLPGKLGNGVIFGHSILPQFYNPKNYMAIFSTLHTLEKGDQIIINYDGITYQYQITEMFEVSPKDISVPDQTYDKQNLTLITCTPPGTYLKRLIVKSKLIPYI